MAQTVSSLIVFLRVINSKNFSAVKLINIYQQIEVNLNFKESTFYTSCYIGSIRLYNFALDHLLFSRYILSKNWRRLSSWQKLILYDKFL